MSIGYKAPTGGWGGESPSNNKQYRTTAEGFAKKVEADIADREATDRKQAEAETRTFYAGQMVTAVEGPYSGITGEVVEANDYFVTVKFDFMGKSRKVDSRKHVWAEAE